MKRTDLATHAQTPKFGTSKTRCGKWSGDVAMTEGQAEPTCAVCRELLKHDWVDAVQNQAREAFVAVYRAERPVIDLVMRGVVGERLEKALAELMDALRDEARYLVILDVAKRSEP